MVIPAVLLMIGKNDKDEAHASFFHPVLWIGLYLLAAFGPLTWGTFQPAAVQSEAPEYVQLYLPAKSTSSKYRASIARIAVSSIPNFRNFSESYGDKINFTRLTIPLGSRKEACIAYYCAEIQKKQNAFAECMFEDPSKDADRLLAHAKDCSIDEETFKSCLDDPKSREAVDEQLKNIESTGLKARRRFGSKTPKSSAIMRLWA